MKELYHATTQMSTNVIAFHYCDVRSVVVAGLQFLEQCLDYAGYVPYLSTISGGIRIYVGNLEVIVSIAVAAIFYFAGALSKGEDKKIYHAIVLDIFRFSVHGGVNIFRGWVECHRWWNLLALLHDKATQRERDHLRLHYYRSIFVLPVFQIPDQNVRTLWMQN